VSKEDKGLKDSKGLKVHKEYKVLKVPKVLKVLKVPVGVLEHKGPQDWNQMLLEARVHREFKEYKVT
jgi:hypothetical protein